MTEDHLGYPHLVLWVLGNIDPVAVIQEGDDAARLVHAHIDHSDRTNSGVGIFDLLVETRDLVSAVDNSFIEAFEEPRYPRVQAVNNAVTIGNPTSHTIFLDRTDIRVRCVKNVLLCRFLLVGR